MAFLIAVEVNGESQIRRRNVFVDVFGQQQCIRAEINKFFASDNCGNDLRHFLVNERFTAGNGHNWCAAFVNRM